MWLEGVRTDCSHVECEAVECEENKQGKTKESFNKLQWNWNTQKRAQVLCGTASAPFVFALGIRAQENSLSPHPRPLSTGVLARTTGELLKYHASASEKSRGVNGTGDFTAT